MAFDSEILRSRGCGGETGGDMHDICVVTLNLLHRTETALPLVYAILCYRMLVRDVCFKVGLPQT